MAHALPALLEVGLSCSVAKSSAWHEEQAIPPVVESLATWLTVLYPCVWMFLVWQLPQLGVKADVPAAERA